MNKEAVWFPNGWVCTETELQGIPLQSFMVRMNGPICLVTVERQGERISARLDMAKRWFIDPVPFCQAEASPAVERLIRNLMER
jgi:hypothetical protein